MRYQNGDVSIDDDFARFGSKSYAIDKITSVDVRGQERQAGCGPVVLIIIGVFIGLAAAGMFADDTKQAIVTGLVAVVLILWGSRLQTKKRLTDYTLLLTTSSAEVQATQTTDGDEVAKMRAAIEAAMVAKR